MGAAVEAGEQVGWDVDIDAAAGDAARGHAQADPLPGAMGDEFRPDQLEEGDRHRADLAGELDGGRGAALREGAGQADLRIGGLQEEAVEPDGAGPGIIFALGHHAVERDGRNAELLGPERHLVGAEMEGPVAGLALALDQPAHLDAAVAPGDVGLRQPDHPLRARIGELQIALVDQGGPALVPGRVEIALLQGDAHGAAGDVAIAGQFQVGGERYRHVPHFGKLQGGEFGAEGARHHIGDADAEGELAGVAVLAGAKLEVEGAGGRLHRDVADHGAALGRVHDVDLDRRHRPARDLLAAVEIDGGVADGEAGEIGGLPAPGGGEQILDGRGHVHGAPARGPDHAFRERFGTGRAGDRLLRILPARGSPALRAVPPGRNKIGLGLARVGKGQRKAAILLVLQEQARADQVDLARGEASGEQGAQADIGGGERRFHDGIVAVIDETDLGQPKFDAEAAVGAAQDGVANIEMHTGQGAVDGLLDRRHEVGHRHRRMGEARMEQRKADHSDHGDGDGDAQQQGGAFLRHRRADAQRLRRKRLPGERHQGFGRSCRRTGRQRRCGPPPLR